MLSSFLTSYAFRLFSGSNLFVASGVDPAADSSREMWNIRYSCDPLGSCNLKLTCFIFSSTLYDFNFLKFNLILDYFVLMCLRSRYTLSSLFSRGLILRFLLLYFAVLSFENLISLANCN